MLGMRSGLDRKNCWTIAEHRGDISPDGLQHLLASARWYADAVRDDLRDYVVEHVADQGRFLTYAAARGNALIDRAQSDCRHRPGCRGRGSNGPR